MPTHLVAVIGSGDCTPDSKTFSNAQRVGELLAQRGYVVVTGGLGGVMQAASRGATESGGTTIGILPNTDITSANPYVTIPIATGMGDARNAVIANTAQAFIAVGGGYGTLSEIAFALKRGKPIVGLDTWDLTEEVTQVSTPEEAVQHITKQLG